MFNNNVFPGFQQKLGYAVEKVFKDEFEYTGKHFENLNNELYVHIEAYSIIAMLDFWITNIFKYSAKYMAGQLLQRINYSPDIIKIKGYVKDKG